MILSKPQAEAVYSAMCALNNFSAQAFDDDVLVKQQPSGFVTVLHGTVVREVYANQAAFATAYGMNPDELQSAVTAAAGGLTQVAIER